MKGGIFRECDVIRERDKKKKTYIDSSYDEDGARAYCDAVRGDGHRVSNFVHTLLKNI